MLLLYITKEDEVYCNCLRYGSDLGFHETKSVKFFTVVIQEKCRIKNT